MKDTGNLLYFLDCSETEGTREVAVSIEDFIIRVYCLVEAGPTDTDFVKHQAPCSLDRLLKKKLKPKERAQWTIGQWRHCLWVKNNTGNEEAVCAESSAPIEAPSDAAKS